MTTIELALRLHDEGCNPNYYAVGARGAASNAFCLTHNGTQWEVYYTERGCDSPPTFSSASEEEACEHFYALIKTIRHDHCVGVFSSEAPARALVVRLETLGIDSRRDAAHYGGAHDPRYRVFVIGRDIFRARDALGDLPLNDATAHASGL